MAESSGGQPTGPAEHGTGPTAQAPGSPGGRWAGPVVGLVGWAAATVVAFVLLDPILAALLAIVGLTGLGMWVLARDWDEHPSFEERELARARRRKEKWDRGAEARARDRARWEAHHARQAGRARAGEDEPGR